MRGVRAASVQLLLQSHPQAESAKQAGLQQTALATAEQESLGASADDDVIGRQLEVDPQEDAVQLRVEPQAASGAALGSHVRREASADLRGGQRADNSEKPRLDPATQTEKGLRLPSLPSEWKQRESK